MNTSILRCPTCTGVQLHATEQQILCTDCHASYPVVDGIASLLPPASRENTFKRSMQEFWGSGWTKRHHDDFHTEERTRFTLDLGAMQLLADIRGDNQFREMMALPLAGKRVLEVGCGAGHSSIIFALQGAQVVGSDLTASAVAMTQQKFRLLGLDAMAVQADAEYLPFADESFDVVFSSGVLHHTPNIEQAVGHLHRVLKPGGHVIVMLYAQRSFYYLVSLLLIQGILFGGIMRHGRDWLGHLTERGWLTSGAKLNPLTRVYSRRTMRRLFRRFSVHGFRQDGFNWADIFPGIYRLIPRRTFGISDVRAMVPGALECYIGRYAGFALTIHAQKPTART